LLLAIDCGSGKLIVGRTNHTQFLGIFPRNKGNSENISLMFSICNALHPSDPHPNTLLNYSLTELEE